MTERIAYVICDLDGCLADDRARTHLLPLSGAHPDAYLPYHAAASFDPVVVTVAADLLFYAFDANSRQRALVLFVTARPAQFRGATLDWLYNSAMPALGCALQFELLMRPDGDQSSSPVLKMNLLNAYFEGVHIDATVGWSQVVAAFDDREDILSVYPISGERRMLCQLPAQPPLGARIDAARFIAAQLSRFIQSGLSDVKSIGLVAETAAQIKGELG